MYGGGSRTEYSTTGAAPVGVCCGAMILVLLSLDSHVMRFTDRYQNSHHHHSEHGLHMSVSGAFLAVYFEPVLEGRYPFHGPVSWSGSIVRFQGPAQGPVS